MANFDFGNTPITSDITLKAGWCCEEVEPENPFPDGSKESELWATFYHGKGARVTLANGEVGYIPKENYGQFSNNGSGYFNSSIQIYPNPDFSGAPKSVPMISVSSNGANKIEFGSDGTETLQANAFKSLASEDFTVTGVITKITKDFIGGYGGWDTTNSKISIIFSPSGTTSENNLSGFCAGYCGISGEIVFDCSNDFFNNVTKAANSNSSMLTCGTYSTQYGDTFKKGFKIGGKAASYVLSNFPNATNLRKLSLM